ncbi:hypothetical protein GCM10010915_11800 [Microbacterium faecale]|uniref:Uncharacterized protein n=1 Tax=Microbacterium faecale TaxID=1804630 RepID=A0A917DE74_9MICO|nr:hypothetical protein [Microbacterium faecale]GGD33060.1 hypothetical protein GCM10010915_11800 [Microbacterium faecale]
MSGAIVTIGSLRFYGDRYRGKDQFHIGPNASDFTGFLDGVTAEWDEYPRDRVGVYDSPARFPARLPHMSGFISAHTHSTLESHRRHLLGLYAGEKRQARVNVGHDWFNLDIEVRNIAFDTVGFAPEATWSVDLRCADPRKRGELRRYTGSSVNVFHRGRFDAYPTVTVKASSAMSGYTISGPGGRGFIVTRSLPAGSTDRIDFETGWVYRNGNLLEKATTRRETWPVPPGTGITMDFSPASGNGQMTVAVHDTDL